MEYATGDVQKNDLKQQTAPHNHAVDVVDPGEGDSEQDEKISFTSFYSTILQV